MVHTIQSHRSSIGIHLVMVFGLLGISVPCMQVPASAEPEARMSQDEATQLRDDAEKMLKGSRSVLGKVLAVTSDQIKVDIGEVQPRFLPLKQAKQKGFPSITEGDDLIVVVNAQNLLVDYHPLDGDTSAHTIIRGEIAQNLPVGQETVVVKSAGKEQSFKIRSQARSKVAAIPIGAAAVFLIDETNQIADVGLSSHDARHSEHQSEQMSPIKGAHRKVEGIITAPLDHNRIAIRTSNGSEKPFEVREILNSKMASLRKGDSVILLVDTENKVIDLAVPPPQR